MVHRRTQRPSVSTNPVDFKRFTARCCEGYHEKIGSDFEFYRTLFLVFSDDHYIGGPVDIWALGVLLYFMVVANMPFRAPTVPQLRSSVLRGDFNLPSTLSLPCIRLIRKL